MWAYTPKNSRWRFSLPSRMTIFFLSARVHSGSSRVWQSKASGKKGHVISLYTLFLPRSIIGCHISMEVFLSFFSRPCISLPVDGTSAIWKIEQSCGTEAQWQECKATRSSLIFVFTTFCNHIWFKMMWWHAIEHCTDLVSKALPNPLDLQFTRPRWRILHWWLARLRDSLLTSGWGRGN